MKIQETIKKIRDVCVMVVGDLMLDRYEYGKVLRISPEAPVPVFAPNRVREMPGGAGNVAMNLAALGCHVKMVARIGTDDSGKALARMLRAQNIKSTFLRQDNYVTPVKIRLIADNNHLLRIDREEIIGLPKRCLPIVERAVRSCLAKTNVVLFSDYAKGFLTSGTCRKIISLCKEEGKLVVVDPKGTDFSKYSGADFVKPNLKEFCDAVGRVFDPKRPDFRRDVVPAALNLMRDCSIGGMMITLGEYGMLYVPSNTKSDLSNVFYVPTKAHEVYDVSGAGDTSLAAFGATIGTGADVETAMAIANAAAGIAVTKIGTSSVSMKELEPEVTTQVPANGSEKILAVKGLKSICRSLKANGVRIGFTNGCFDCCHLGHISSLRAAKQLCDVLIVGVNSDKWIKMHKGENRPVQDERTRMEILASFGFVDFVVGFSTETALPLVKLIRPDVIAKEGYAMADWPEGRFVASIGGKVVTLPRLEGYSTTSIVNRMS